MRLTARGSALIKALDYPAARAITPARRARDGSPHRRPHARQGKER
jgi:hypothetical protein